MKKGYTLVEIMVVTAIFAILALLVSGVILNSVRNTQKSESLSNVRVEMENVISVMERHLRNSDHMVPIAEGIQYTDPLGVEAMFVCEDDMGITKVASKSTDPLWDNIYYLSSDRVNVVSCDFTVISGSYDIPDKVEVKLKAESAAATGVLGGEVEIQTELNLRNY